MANISIAKAKAIISTLVQQQLDGKNPPPVFLWGPPGVGKSEGVREIAAEKGIDIIDIRLGYAARMLVDTSSGISEICYACGFNNLSNFNRIFKAKRGYTPRDFRALFKKNRVFV